MTLRLSAVIVALLAAVVPLRADDWPQFLGANRDNRSPETGLNLDWKAKPPKVLWKVPLGAGFGSVSVVGDRLFTMAQRGERDYVLCFEAGTGKELWKLDAAPGFVDRWEKQGRGPRATPTYDRGKLYCQFSDGDLLCVDADKGKELWRTNIFKAANTRDRNGDNFYWGLAASPLVEGDLVVVQPGGKENASVLALHKDSGKVAWGAGTDPSGYASPIAVAIDGKRQLVVPTGQSVLGIDPAKGEVLWRYAFGNRFDATCATPLWADGVLFVSAAYGTGCAALEVARDGEKWSVKERWRNKELQTIFGTGAVVKGHVYGPHGDLGPITLRCLDLKTGELKWAERQPARSSLLAVEGHLVCLDERGGLRLVEAKPDGYAVKGELKDVLEYKAWAAPALAGGRLYLRDQKSLVCLDLRKE
jgi:outer membrane protein assembly factor BamB